MNSEFGKHLTLPVVRSILNGAMRSAIKAHKLTTGNVAQYTESITKRAANQIYSSLIDMNLNSAENQELIRNEKAKRLAEADEVIRLTTTVKELISQRDNLLKKLQEAGILI